MFKGGTGTILATGFVTMGIITAAFMPGRQTVKFTTAAGNAGSKLYGTVISGKSQA